jgi:hypothetical protein
MLLVAGLRQEHNQLEKTLQRVTEDTHNLCNSNLFIRSGSSQVSSPSLSDNVGVECRDFEDDLT